jgi:predicted glutamine amidotransferase
MCRLYGFRSSIRSSVHHSLVNADNALARQSERHSHGWGVGFYVDGYPHLIRNDQQAWADSLFRDLSGVVSTRTLIAHIRLATVGAVRVLNCHPFQHGRWCFAHNGEIAGYERPEVRERLGQLVDGRFRRYILGDTDSELLFHIFLSQLARQVDGLGDDGVGLDEVRDALRITTQLVLAAAPDEQAADAKHNKLTVLLTNGDLMLGYRYKKELHYSTYKARCPERDTCFAFEERLCEKPVERGVVKHLLVTSEPLAQGPNVCVALEDDHYVAVRHGMFFERGKLGAV